MGSGNHKKGDDKMIRTYKDLDVYQKSMYAAKQVLIRLIPMLPASEKYDLASQMRRCCKAIPALIAEGYAKKHQQKAFQKYLEDALGEANEMNPHITFCRDVYNADEKLCNQLLDTYDIIGKQLYNLRRNWTNYREFKQFPPPISNFPTSHI